MKWLFTSNRPSLGSLVLSERPVGAVGRGRSARLALRACACLLALWFLCGLSVYAGRQQAIAGSTGGVRADGRLAFISPEGRVLASIIIEIADTPRARATGLMGRTGLNDSSGMLFVHEEDGPKSYWMRNTPTSLDIIFVSAAGRVIDIAANTQPMSDSVYSSKGPALFVVEVPAGFCTRYGIVEGTGISWERN